MKANSRNQGGTARTFEPRPSTQSKPSDKLGHVRDTVKMGGLVSRRHQSSGASVRELQEQLRTLGYPVKVDGKFGPETEAAVEKFQSDRGIKIDGLVGAETLAELDKKVAAPLTQAEDSYQAPAATQRPQAGSYGANRPQGGATTGTKPAADKPAPEKPAADKPAPEKPAGEKPAPEKPAADKPAPEKPTAEKPNADKPAPEKPAADKPAADNPAPEKPAAEKPAADKPAAEEPAAAKPPTRPEDVDLSKMDPEHHAMLEARAVQLHTGVARPGTDEGGVYNAMDGLTPTELVELQAVYADHYNGANMREKIEADFSGEEETRALLHLEGKHAEANAIGMHRALYPEGEHNYDPMGADFADSAEVMAMLEGHSEAEIAEIKAAYEAKYGRALDSEFGNRMINPKEAELAKAQTSGVDGQATAVKVHQALSGGLFGTTKESAVKALMEDLSPEDAAAVNKAYEGLYGHTMRSDLKAKLDGSELDQALAASEADPIGASAARIRDELDNWVSHDEDAIEKMLSGKTQTERKQIMAAYKREYGSDMRADLGNKLSTEAYARVDELLTTGKLNPARDVYKATHGWGTDEELLLHTLQGKSKEQIDKLRTDFQKLYGLDLDQVIDDELGGRDEFNAKMMLKGRPKNLDQAMEQLEERYQFERGKGDGFFSGLTDLFFEDGKILDINHARVSELYRAAKADGKITAEERQRLGQLLGYTGDDVKTYAAAKDTVADVATNAATTTLAVGATVLSGGSMGPVATALLAGGTTGTKIGLNRAIRGAAYGSDAMLADGASGVADYLGGQVAGAAAGRIGEAWQNSTRLTGLGNRVGVNLTGELGTNVVQTGSEWALGGAISGGVNAFAESRDNSVLEATGEVIHGAAQGVQDGVVGGAKDEVRDRTARRIFKLSGD